MHIRFNSQSLKQRKNSKITLTKFKTMIKNLNTMLNFPIATVMYNREFTFQFLLHKISN